MAARAATASNRSGLSPLPSQWTLWKSSGGLILKEPPSSFFSHPMHHGADIPLWTNHAKTGCFFRVDAV